MLVPPSFHESVQLGYSTTQAMDRRRFLAGSAGTLLTAKNLVARGSSARSPSDRSYRIVYNDDADAPVRLSSGLDDFLELAIDRFIGTQVDALFWNIIASDILLYPTKVGEMVGSRGQAFESAEYFLWFQKLLAIMEERPDYLQAMADRARAIGLEFFPSLRMNDCHDSPVWKAMDTYSHYRREHPELLLGDAVHPGFSTGFNFAFSEVRERRFRIVEELITQYRFDGIEMDFLRHPAYFKPGEAVKNRDLLTGLVKKVNALLRRVGEERNRHLKLAVRVPVPFDVATKMGLDVQTWIQEELVDLVIAATPRGFELSLPLEEYVEAVRSRPMKLLAQLGWHQPVQKARGAALNFWNQGADGIYLFNWYARKDRRHESLREIGNPAYLRRRSKVYEVHRREGDLWVDTHPPAQLPVQLWRSGSSTDLQLRIGDDVGADTRDRVLEKALLRIRLEGSHRDDRLEIRLNGTDLDSQSGRLKVDDQHMYVWQYWMEYTLPVPPLKRGVNQFRIRLANRHPRLSGPLTVTEFQVQLDYGSSTETANSKIQAPSHRHQVPNGARSTEPRAAFTSAGGTQVPRRTDLRLPP